MNSNVSYPTHIMSVCRCLPSFEDPVGSIVKDRWLDVTNPNICGNINDTAVYLNEGKSSLSARRRVT